MMSWSVPPSLVTTRRAPLSRLAVVRLFRRKVVERHRQKRLIFASSAPQRQRRLMARRGDGLGRPAKARVPICTKGTDLRDRCWPSSSFVNRGMSCRSLANWNWWRRRNRPRASFAGRSCVCSDHHRGLITTARISSDMSASVAGAPKRR